MNKKEALKKLEKWLKRNGCEGELVVSTSKWIHDFFRGDGWQFEILEPISGTYYVFPDREPTKVG